MLTQYISPLQNQSIADNAIPSSFSTPLRDFIYFQQNIDQQSGIQNYINKETGDEITFDDYWAKKNYESQPLYRLGSLLRERYDQVKNWVCSFVPNIIFQTTTNDTQLDEEYNKLSKNIDHAIDDAKENHKPLLILIGETHRDLSSIMNEAMILHLAKNKLKLKTVFTELFDGQFYEATAHPFRCTGVTLHSIIDDILKNLRISKVPVDMGICGLFITMPKECLTTQYKPWKNGGSLSSEAMLDYRNIIMADIVLSHKKQNSIMIVGAGHMNGLIKRTDLNKFYHLFPINVGSIAKEDLYKVDKSEKVKFIFSKEVLQAPLKSITVPKAYFPSKQVIVEKAKEVHERNSIKSNAVPGLHFCS